MSKSKAAESTCAPGVTGASGQPTIVGHSMGGGVTATAATHYGTQIDSIVVIDSPLRDRAPEEQRLRNRKHRGYRTAMADKIRSILQLRGPFVELAEDGHHPMLDQPLPLVAALRTLLEFWSIT
jgi:pimeloyl-ACP methyl ester carboxylesterase